MDEKAVEKVINDVLLSDAMDKNCKNSHDADNYKSEDDPSVVDLEGTTSDAKSLTLADNNEEDKDENDIVIPANNEDTTTYHSLTKKSKNSSRYLHGKYISRRPVVRKIYTYSQMRRHARERILGRSSVLRNNDMRGKLYLDVPNNIILKRNNCSVIRRGILLALKKRKNFSSRTQFMSKSSKRGIGFFKLRANIQNQNGNVERFILKRTYFIKKGQ